MSIVLEIKESTIAGNHQKVADLTRKALDEHISADQIIQEGFIPAMAAVGEEFGAGRIYIPEMLIAARAMKAGMEILNPMLVGEKSKTLGRIVIGTVQGDMHDIGKNLVVMMLEGAGFEVIDLGIDVPSGRFIEAVKTHKPHFLAMSALLTTTMGQMRKIIEALEEAGVRKDVKVLVGGAPVTKKFADEIGADGYGENAGDAATKAKQLMQA